MSIEAIGHNTVQKARLWCGIGRETGLPVQELSRRNWSPEKIGRELGMEPDEVLRLRQITGLAELFADREFSEAWEA